MVHDIPKPEISPDFTIDDIHKIREWHYERLKDATSEEMIDDIKKRAAPGLEYLAKLRQSRTEQLLER